MESKGMNVFTYGSLMFEPVWSRLVRGSYGKKAARLHGFTRRRIRGDVYPVVFRSQDEDWVDGIVYLDVSDEDLLHLDSFEGEIYARQSHWVAVEGADEGIVADAYVLKESYAHMRDDREWDPSWFARHGLPAFIGHYKGFH
jgi:gamma-glutamylcyclotransferase (GGCT)/AIG2-like uncharacterized protein YtfP